MLILSCFFPSDFYFVPHSFIFKLVPKEKVVIFSITYSLKMIFLLVAGIITTLRQTPW